MLARQAVAVLVVFVCGVAGELFAGSLFQVKCKNSGCRLQNDVQVGRGMSFELVSGYCTNCKKFVEQQWNIEDENPQKEPRRLQPRQPTASNHGPAKLGVVWNPATGQMTDLYPCPHCAKPFLNIPEDSFEAKGDRDCPRCHEPTLTVKHTACYD